MISNGRLVRFALTLVCLAASANCLAQDTSGREMDQYGGVLALKDQKTGWFHVEQIQINGRWMFVTPEGHGFFSLGVTHAVDCIRKDELNLFESKYSRSNKQLSDFILRQFDNWGYNSSGYGALPPMETRIPYVAAIWTEGPRSLSAGPKSVNTDIFDPKVQKRLRKTVKKQSARHVANPYCLGYVFIDLPIWSPTFAGRRGGKSYVDFVRSLGPASPGRKAYTKFLTARYRTDQSALEKIYGIQVDAFESLSTVDLTGVSATKSDRVAKDDELFLNEMADVYYQCVVGELKRVDPNHLICGDRLIAGSDKTPDSILKTVSKYVDVLSFQPLGTKQLIGDYIDHVTKLTGKPVLLADVNTMTRRPKKDETDTTDYERSAGEYTLVYYRNAAASRSCIGIHRCTIRDYQPWNTRFHRRGLLKADDSPYSLLIDYARRANQQVFDMVYGG